jgi:hypothetical protein
MVPDLTIAGYAVPVILTVIMGLIFKFVPTIADRWKSLLTVIAAIGLAVVSMFYNAPEVELTLQAWVETILGGILIGAAAIGIYEIQRAVAKPRS